MSAYTKDLTERVAATFLEGFLGGIVLTQYTDQEMWVAAAVAGVASAAALLKGLLAKKTGDPKTASLADSD